jgi:para-aminobenzoate synthetase/4-amino-4-deoxychorismate lyase
MIPADQYFALFDDDNGRSLVLSDFVRSITYDGTGSLQSVFDEIGAASANGQWVALAADYALGVVLEPAASRKAPSQASRPLLSAWVFAQAQKLDCSDTSVFLSEHIATVAEHDQVAGVADAHPALGFDRYFDKVGDILRWITDGDGYQVNFTFPLRCRVYGSPLALYARLRARQPVRYGAYFGVPGKTVLSLSPELFFERAGERVTTRPMKGTANRGKTAAEDDENRRGLLASAKERAENIMIVDLLRNDLGRLAPPGGVRVESLCDVEAYPTLWQMVSTVSADLPGVGLYDLFRSLFPCGSITGAPKIAAMQKIEDLEESPRELYTGTLGWVAPGGDCRFNVAIRTLDVADDGSATLGVGSGIVIDADAGREYAECLLKSRFLTGFDPGFELIETIRFEQGRMGLLPFHLERLAASAAALGFACDLNVISAALAVHAAAAPEGLFRVRLSLSHDGGWKISSTELPSEPVGQRYALVADELLDPGDYLLRHKTSARSRYDRQLQRLSGRPDVFDAIFLNTRGEVCEGARSNVFVEHGGVLLTPPATCGLLPGVMRRHLLESGRAVERILTRDDLYRAQRIFLGNALRGMIQVSLIDTLAKN